VARLVERDGSGDVSEVSFAVEVDAPPERVWAVVSDPHNLPHWERHIVDVIGVPPDGLTQGAEYTTVMRFMAVRTSVRCRVLEWEPPAWAVILLSGILDATVATRVDPLPRDRSLLRHEVDYHFGRHPLGELVARSLRFVGGAQLALRHGVLAQKRQIESR
jgi:hypothetical protein